MESKWNVLIVDDEFRIGQLIRKLVHWDEYNLHCVDVVDNGERALEIIQENPQVDIVITDIRMPKINGLDLIRMSKEIRDDIRYVVISGYREFEYAKKALRYGVQDYLLKPVNEVELNRAMKMLSESLGREREERVETQSMREHVLESQKIIKKNFLKNIIDEQDELDHLDKYVNLEGELYRGIDIKLDYVDMMEADTQQDRLIVERISGMVEGILNQHAEEVLICEKEYLHIFCLFNYDSSNSRKIRNSINDILTEIVDYLMGFEQYEVTIGVGTERTVFGEIRFSIGEAKRAAESRIRYGTGRLIYADTLGEQPAKTELDAAQLEEMKNAVESLQQSGLEQLIDKAYQQFQGNDSVDFSGCYTLAEHICDNFVSILKPDKDSAKRMQEQIHALVHHTYSMNRLKWVLKQSLGNQLQSRKSAIEAESMKPIRQAEQFVQEHYADKIVLEDLAELVGLNPVYFSVLFKKETGINFSAYLVNVRMEHAKELLLRTNETVAAIGSMVGYKDYRYFSQIFTKQIGVKPALYRKLNS